MSGTRPKSELTLLADVALQLVEGKMRGAIVVCDGSFRVLAATPSAQSMVEMGPSGQLPEQLLVAARSLRETYASPDARSIVEMPRGPSLSIRIHPLVGLGAAAFALILERGLAYDDAAVHSLTSSLSLTVRERQLVALLRRGLSNREIATSLRLTEGTVKVYMHDLFVKLQVESRMQLVARIEQLLVQARSA